MSDNPNFLIDLAKKGDIIAFEKLIEDHQKKVYNIALRFMGNSEDASEIAQEAFIRVYRSLKNFKGKSSFSTWLYRIVVNICMDEMRKRKKQNIVYIDEIVQTEKGEYRHEIESMENSPQQQVEINETRNEIYNAIKSLSDEHKAVIILKDIQGFSYEEIAAIMKCPEGTVKSRLNRARNILRNILKKNMEHFNRENV